MTLKGALTIAAAACCLCAAASADEFAFGKAVKGWWVSGSAPAEYEFGTTGTGCVSGKCAFIRAKNAAPKGFGTLMQEIAPDAYHGRRVRVSAMIKTADASKAQLWMRIDGPDGKTVGFYNMDDRPVTGTTDWKRYSVVLDVPPGAEDVAFGYFLNVKGTAWADDFRLEPVGKDVPVSKTPLPPAPANMGFEQ